MISTELGSLALGAGVVASAIGGGAFFAVSNFVMPALSTLPERDGVAAMQAMNVAAPNRVFVTALFASVLAGLPAVAGGLTRRGSGTTLWAVAGVVLGGVSLAITVGRNVPQNNQLERLDAESGAAASYWRTYQRVWTRDNTLRAIASLASAVAYAAAMNGFTGSPT